MRKNLGAKPYTYPRPVFIVAAYGPDGTPDAMNAAWGGISDTTELSLCLSAGHKTTKSILGRKAFTESPLCSDDFFVKIVIRSAPLRLLSNRDPLRWTRYTK